MKSSHISQKKVFTTNNLCVRASSLALTRQFFDISICLFEVYAKQEDTEYNPRLCRRCEFSLNWDLMVSAVVMEWPSSHFIQFCFWAITALYFLVFVVFLQNNHFSSESKNRSLCVCVLGLFMFSLLFFSQFSLFLFPNCLQSSSASHHIRCWDAAHFFFHCLLICYIYCLPSLHTLILSLFFFAHFFLWQFSISSIEEVSL